MGNLGEANAIAKRSPGMQLAEPLLTVVGYNAMTELGWISAIVSRETDDSVAVKLEEEEVSEEIEDFELYLRQISSIELVTNHSSVFFLRAVAPHLVAPYLVAHV